MGRKEDWRWTRGEVARVLQEIGLLLQIKGENPFKIRAYERGARAIGGCWMRT